jgi:hypothetical protein
MRRVFLLLALLIWAASPALAQETQTLRMTLMSSFDLDGEAADDDQVVLVATLADSTTFTLQAQPDSCRLIDMTIADGDSSITVGTVTVTGTDCLGYARVCTFDFAVVGTRGSGVKTLPVTTGPLGSSCYLGAVTSVISSALTGEGGGADTIKVGYTSNSVNGWAVYGRLKLPGPAGEHGVDPFGATGVGKLITTSGVASTTVTDVTGADDAFDPVAAGDLIIVVQQGQTYERKITAKASADSITINAALNIAATGITWRYKKSYFSTDPTDDMSIPVAGWKTVMFPWAIAANANTGGVITNLECSDNRGPAWPTNPWTQIATTTTASAGTQAWTLGTSTAPYVVDLTLAPFQACRFGLKFGTGDDGDGAAEDISVDVVLSR